MKTIGFIGLGAMGAPMVANLIKAGYRVRAYDVRPQAVQALADQGAVAAASIADAVRDADAVITILPKDSHVLEVYLGQGGILEHAGDAAVCIEMTSCLSATIEDIAGRARQAGKGLRFLDAPVSGGVAGAQSGSLTIMAGGDRAIFDECSPILEAVGKKIFYTGGVGSGKAIKMVNQLLNAGNTLIAAEAVQLAKSLGLDMELLCRVVGESSGSSWVFEINVPKFMLPQSFEGGFRLDLMKKDLGLSIEHMNAEGLALPLTALAYQVYQAVDNQGRGGKNYNVVSRWLAEMNREQEV